MMKKSKMHVNLQQLTNYRKITNRYETVMEKMELDFQEVRNKGFQLLGQF